jgi:hypothetical protein
MSFKRIFSSLSSHSKLVIISLTALFLFSATFAFASPRSSPYLTNETLDPTCAPTETNCYVANALTTGVAGGQTLVGGASASDNLTLSSTSNATKGKIIFGTSAYDEANNRLGIGTESPGAKLTVVGDSSSSTAPYPYYSYTAFGDSITAGVGASTLANDYVSVLASDLSVTVADDGVSGSTANSQEDSVYTTNVPSTGSPLYTYMIGTNDISFYGSNVDEQTNYQSFIMASAAYLAIPNSNKVFGQSVSGVTYTGTWTNSTYYGGAISKYSTTNGDTATFTTTGTVAYIAYTILNGNGGQFSVTVDGTSEGTYDNYGYNNSSVTGSFSRNYGSGLARISGLSSGTHTIVLTVTSTTSASNQVFFDWATGNANLPTSGGPTVLEGEVIPQYPTNLLVPVYNTLVADNVSTLSADGLNVHLVDTYDAIDNPSTELVVPPGIHPNDIGHTKMAQAYLAVIQTVTGISNPTNKTLAVNSSTGNNQLIVTSAGYVGIGISNPISPLTIQPPTGLFDSANSSTLLPLTTYYTSTGVKSLEIRANAGGNLALGVGAGSSLTSALYNNFFGQFAGYFNTTGSNNNFLGTNAGYFNTTGSNNNFLGTNAGYFNTTGYNNNFLGYQSGYSNTTGSGDNFLGYQSGYLNTTGVSNNFFGINAGFINNTGYNNNFLGYQSGYSNTTGYSNNFLGYQSGYSNTTSFLNNFLGYQTGYSNTTGYSNNFFGGSSGYSNTTGVNNNFIGTNTGYFNTIGSADNFLGYQAGYTNTTGSYNNFFGSSAGLLNTTGSYNNFFGYQSGYSNTTGQYNNFFGQQTGYPNTIGSADNFLGYQAGYTNTTGSYNNFFGYQSGYSNTTGQYNNFFGQYAGYSNTGNSNNFFGLNAGFSNTTGQYNNFFGQATGKSNTIGSYNITLGSFVDVPSATTSGQLNIGNLLYGTNLYSTNTLSATPVGTGRIGIRTSSPSSVFDVTSLSLGGTQATTTSGISLNNTTAAVNNTQQVSPALRFTGQGYGTTASSSQAVSFRAYVTPVQSTVPTGYLGFGSSINGGAYTDNQLILTSAGFVGISNLSPAYLLHVGQSSTPSGIVTRFQNTSGTCDVNPTLGAGGFACSSDMTLKKNITDIGDNTTWSFTSNLAPSSNTVLDKILTLTPVMYNWNTEQDTDPKHAGFIAQQVQQIFPDLVSTDPTTHLLSLNYTGLVPYTIEAIKEMHLQIQNLSSLDTTSPLSLGSLITKFLANAENQIADLYARTIHSSKVQTDELCVGSTCVSQAQFLQMVQNSNQTVTPSDTPTSSDQTQTTSDNSSSTDTQTATDQTTTSDTTQTTSSDTTSTPDTTTSDTSDSSSDTTVTTTPPTDTTNTNTVDSSTSTTDQAQATPASTDDTSASQ